jgi:hypothetical protein
MPHPKAAPTFGDELESSTLDGVPQRRSPIGEHAKGIPAEAHP